MKITLELSNIDYGALTELLLPFAREKIGHKEGTAAAVLAKIASVPPSVAAKMVDLLPQETKDELVVLLVNKNKEKIISALSSYAADKGLGFNIRELEVE